MGDVVLTTPLCHALRQAFPEAQITYLAESPYQALMENHPDVDRLIALRRDSIRNQLGTFIKLIGNDFDVAIDLFGNPRSALLTFLSGASMRIGGDFRGRRIFYTHKIHDDGHIKTAIQFHLQYLEPLEVSPQACDPYLVLTDAERAWARGFLAAQGFALDRMLIGIHPGATWPAKRWFPERFAALADRLAKEFDAQVFFTTGPGEEDLIRSVAQTSRISLNEPAVLNLRQLAAVLQCFDLYIANDCGPMHIAPAVGTRTVGIFGPGEPEIWFPYDFNKGHRFVHHTVDCSRCHRDLCDRMDCMKAISVENILAAALDSLNSGSTI